MYIYMYLYIYQLSEDHRRHRRMCNTVSRHAEVSVILTVIALRL